MAGRDGAVQELLALRAWADARDAAGMTPSHSAALAGDAGAGALRALLDGGALPSASCAALRTPLHLAAQEGSVQAVEALLRAGALLDAQDRRMDTPLHLAARPSPQPIRRLCAMRAVLRASPVASRRRR